MVRLSRPLKRFVLVGALAIGLLPGTAQAKWIKATVTGTVTTTTTPPATSLNVNDLVTLDFIIQNYQGTSGTPNIWLQSIAKPNYSQLFGYGTGTNSTGLTGNYNASLVPIAPGNTIQVNDDGSNFLMRVSGVPNSGLSITQGSTSVNVNTIGLSGTIDTFSSSFPTSLDVVDFLSAAQALGTHTCSTTCGIGSIVGDAESPITFSWNSITFQQIAAVPAPLPLAGGLAAFRFSRKIRARIKNS